MDQEKIGKFIAYCRKQKKLTQVELASMLGVSDKSVSKWENGKCMPDLSLFKPLCEILDITINDLMSGEKVDDKEYINTLEENIVNMVSDVEKNNIKNKKIGIIIFISILCLVFIGRCFYFYYEIDIKFEEKVITCEITDKQLSYSIKGQSVLNTYHTIKKLNDKTLYFFHSTVNIYNKRRSNWEYSKSMARLIQNKNIQFGYNENIELEDDNVEVYYTDESIKTINKATTAELNDIIEKSYLICKTNKQ